MAERKEDAPDTALVARTAAAVGFVVLVHDVVARHLCEFDFLQRRPEVGVSWVRKLKCFKFGLVS